MPVRKTVPVRGIMLHLTHYDPTWYARKAREKPFDLEVGLEAIDAMAQAGLNLLMIDCADGVRYKSHPELARPYSVPMKHLRTLVARAERHGIEVVPKLNFSLSSHHHHNDWFRPHDKLFDNAEYWRLAFEIIDELIQNTHPRRFFHIGMDEDHKRSHRQYVRAILMLRKGLRARKLRTIIWNDSSVDWPPAEVHKEKSIMAEKKLPHDVVQVVWDYRKVSPKVLRRVAGEGFDLWVAPGSEPRQVAKARKALLACGGKGILLTRWKSTVRSARREILDWILTAGQACGG